MDYLLDDTENWRRIVIDLIKTDYEVSDLANVRKIDSEKLLKKTKSRTVYKDQETVNDTVSLYINYKYKQVQVKRLVATAFLDNPNGYNVVMRKKGNSDAASNLEWASKSAVMKEAMDGVHKSGKKHWRYGTKLSRKTKDKISRSTKGRNNSKFKGMVICEGRKFASAVEAAEKMKVSVTTVLRRIRSENKEWAAWYIEGQMKAENVKKL